MWGRIPEGSRREEAAGVGCLADALVLDDLPLDLGEPEKAHVVFKLGSRGEGCGERRGGEGKERREGREGGTGGRGRGRKERRRGEERSSA